ncbi:MAG: hypothetical protein ACI4HK_02000 [Ruminococcus sp.]
MKTKFKRIGRQSLSVILAVMMMVSTMLVGMVTSNAAEFTGDYLYIDLSQCNSDITLNGINIYENENGQNQIAWLSTSNTEFKDLGGRIYQFNVGGYLTEGKTIQSVQVALNGTSSKTENVTDASLNCLKIDSNGNPTWTTYSGGSTTKRTVTVNAPNTTYSVKVNGTETTSVAEGGTYTFTVEPVSGYKITGVTVGTDSKDVNNPTGSNEYSLTMGNSNVTINVTTESTSTPSSSNTVYLRVNTSTYSSPYKVHIWKDGGSALTNWNATDNSNVMTLVKDEGNNISVYSFAPTDGKLLSNYDSIIFRWNDGSTSDINGVTLQGRIYDLSSGTWSDYEEKAKPTAKLTVGSNEVFFGKSVTLAPGYTISPEGSSVAATGTYSVSPNTATVNEDTGIFEVPKSVGADATSSIAYTVTYTVTLSNGESDSASVTITAKDSTEQTAYKALLAGLGTSTYPDPSTYTGKTAATVAAYKTAYDAAVTVKDAGYPDADGTANTAAKSALDDAKSKLADKTSLPTPVLAVEGGNNTVAYGDTVNLYVSNESTGNYPDTMTYSLYTSSSNKVADFAYGQKVTIPSSFLAVGENGFYVIAATNDTDNYNMSNIRSATITVNVVEMVKVSVSAGENGTAYISKYYDVNNTEKTSTSLKSVAVKKDTAVTFTAEPNSGYQVASWNGTASTELTYTTTVSEDTTVSVTFEEKPVVEVALLGKTITIDTTSTSNQFTDGLTFVNNQAIIEVSGDSNWFGFVDSNGNYYNVSTNTQVSSGNTYTVNKVDNAPASGCVSWISASTSTFYKLTITEFIPGTSLTYSLEQISTPWRIYGDTTYGYFNKGWSEGASGEPIALSYKGNANQYYFPVEVTDPSNKIYFGLYFNSAAHQPSIANLEMVENTKYGSISTWTGLGYDKNFQINPDTTGTYYICVDTSENKVWYEKEATEPVPVSLTVNSSVEGGNAYIYSYTDNDTSSVVTNPGVTTVNAKPNTDVVFKADAVEGYYVKWLTSLNSTITTGEEFTLSKVTGTDPIKVSATYEQIVNYNVTVKAQDGGSVTAFLGGVQKDVSNAISVASNDVITLKAIPDSSNNYVFKGWEVNSTNYTLSSGTLTSEEINVTPLGNVTFTAMFEVKQGEVDTTYQLMLSSSDSGIPQDSSGSTKVKNLTFYKTTDENDVATYSVTVPTATFSSTGSNYFAFSTTGKNTGIPQYGTAPTFTVDASTASLIKEKRVQIWGGYNFPHFKFTDASTVLSVKITYTPDTHTYTLSAVAEAPLEDAVDVYVTNGNLVGMKYGSTKITSGITENYLKEESHTSYIKYRAKLGDKVTVECTMDDAKAKLGYYVYAFVVNGAKVDVVQNGNVYQTAAPLTLTETKTEITPVYYNTNIEKNGDYVTLYVKAPSDLEPKWGNSIAIYSWYKNDGANMDGDYPGQLMMRDTQGKYIAKISKYAYAEDSNGKFVRQNTQNIAGITINNYHENQGDVHDKFLNTTQQKNRQSYDYNDFVKIAQMGYDTVEFDVKYYDSAETGTNQSKFMSNNKTLGTAPSGSKLTFAETYNATPYENLTNIDGELVSILGYDDATIRIKQLADHQEVTGLDKNKKLHIISVGNQNNIPNGGTAKWATCWYVYDSDGKYITCGMPSDFIPSGSINAEGKFEEAPLESQSKAYQKIVEKSLQYNSALISYEAEQDATSTNAAYTSTGIRCDGRWYYARSADSVAVDLGIIYKTDEEATVWTVDRPTEDSAITGTITGGTASFSYTDTIGNTHTNLASDSVERNTVLSINATNGTKYKFTGWAVPAYDADGNLTGYTPLGLTDYNATYTVATATKIYAMYEPYASGQLTLTHSKYVGADAHNGLGLFTIQAYLCDENGNPVDRYAVSTASVSDSVTLNIQNLTDAYVKVTLYTQSYAKSHFLNFYYPNVSNGTTTLTKDGNLAAYYDKECTADNQATNSFMVKVSDLFVDDTQAIMALNYYSDLKLPEVASNITFNYNPYKEAPNPNPAPDMNGSGTTKFALTITKDSDGTVVYETTTDAASLTLKGNTDLKDILEDYTTNSKDYTVTITLKATAASHCDVGATYRQNVDAVGTYTYTNATADTGTWTYADGKYTAKLSALFDTTNQVFNTNTINFYTDFTAKEFNYNVTFKYLGYESRAYYDENGYTQSPIINPESNWWKNYTVSGKFYGAEIDTYVDTTNNTFKDAFLLKVAPYEDNFVQTIKWQLGENVDYTTQADDNIVATINATYDNDYVTVTADLGDGSEKKLYDVNYASLVTGENLINNPENKEGYLIVAPVINTAGEKFSYWTIVNDDGVEVAKCYFNEFNYVAYDNYTVTACYGKDNVESEKQKVSATMTFLEYSRNQYDTDKDKVYADFAVSYNYNGKMLCADNNDNVICGVAFVINKAVSSPSDATQELIVNSTELLEKVKDLNNGSTDKVLSNDSIVYNYKINKSKIDNKNRLEYSWNVNNSDNNNNLTILAYSYIYNTVTEEFSISAPQTFKFYNVGHKTYKG